MRRFSSSGTRHESGSMGAPWVPITGRFMVRRAIAAIGHAQTNRHPSRCCFLTPLYFFGGLVLG